MQKKRLAAGAPPRTPLGELTALPRLAALLKNFIPLKAFQASVIACPYPLIFKPPRAKIL